MWDYQTKKITPSGIQYQLFEEGQVLSFEHVLELWQSSSAFRIFYNQLLGNCTFEAYFWEHPPISIADLDQDYEFILIDSPSLAGITAESEAFAEHFTGTELVASFPNLRGDAQLLAPLAFGELEYPHLASFCRRAPIHQIHKFWASAGQLVTQQLSLTPRWLSTSGLGVYWLHLRLDNQPKYYHHQAYRLP